MAHKDLRSALAASVAICAAALAAPAVAQTRSFNVAEQPALTGIPEFARQADVQILVSETATRGRSSNAVRGTYSIDEGLRRLLRGTGLGISSADGRTFILSARRGNDPGEGEAGGAAADDAGATPEILVVGERLTLNADIRRTEDDIQPYVVLERGDIERSGATTVEGFLRQRLPMAVGAQTSSQADSSTGNGSAINLRGLGANQTLILVDGRRIASQSFNGSVAQPDITGIPLSAIERIEVLPSTAGGIYGGNATGGVINIILRRNFRGIDLAITYDNVFEGDAQRRRVDASFGFGFNDGRSSLLVSGSWSDSEDLLWRERDFYDRAIARILANNPNAILGAATPPLGATTNIRSANGSNLTLKPAFGGGALGSPITFVPFGYAGPGSDLGAALIANAGRYNLALANTSQPDAGGRRSLLNAPMTATVNATLRHEFNDWLDAFVEAAWSVNEGSFQLSPAFSGIVSLAANAPGNPFNQQVFIAVPLVGADQETTSRYENFRLVAGVTFDLPLGWRGALDHTWTIARLRGTSAAGSLNGQESAAISSGTINVFRDLNTFPADFASFWRPLVEYGPGKTELHATALRLSGPLGFRLPGGEPTATVLFEHREESLSDFPLFTGTGTIISYARSQTINAAYGELLVPLVGPSNRVPLVSLFELQLAARVEHFDITGANQTSTGAPPTEVRNTFTSVNPTIGARWQPIPDITFRGSYGTGFLPPGMNQLSPNAPRTFNFATLLDPLRGNAPVGLVTLTTGGNPDLRPERSKSWSAGLILTPRFLPGFRLSADWTRIEKTDNIGGFQITPQSNFLAALAFAPDRFIRNTDPASFGAFPVGPIIAIDQTNINIAYAEFEGIDFALDQRIGLGRLGELNLAARATRAIHLRTQLSGIAPLVENVGLINAPKWRGNAELAWERGGLTIAWNTRYIDSYAINAFFVPSQGSARIRSQLYHDLFVSYRLGGALARTTLQAGIRNILGNEAPTDISVNFSGYYSPWADPRETSYFFTLRQSF